MTDHFVVFEQTSSGWSAHVPDLPGLGVAGSTYVETEGLIREGIVFHVEGPDANCDQVSISA